MDELWELGIAVELIETEVFSSCFDIISKLRMKMNIHD